MKACQIFKTQKEYKIITMYKTDTGSYKLMEPIFILPNTIEKGKFTISVYDSLNSSKLIKNPESNNSKELLQKLKETSFNKFYQKSKCCMLFVENDKVVIEPQIYSTKFKGLETIHDKVVILKTNLKSEVIEEVLRFLD